MKKNRGTNHPSISIINFVVTGNTSDILVLELMSMDIWRIFRELLLEWYYGKAIEDRMTNI